MLKYIGLAGGGVVVLLGLSAGFGSFYTVDQKERAVILRNGATIGVADPGLHWKVPFIDDYVKISMESKAIEFPNVPAYSRDQQTAEISIVVNYHLVPADSSLIYERYGGESGVVSRIVVPKVNEQLKNVFGQFNAVTSIQDRSRLNTQVAQAITDAINGPIIIDSVQITNIDFSNAYEQSIEARMLAEVEVQKLAQNAEREKVQAQITVTKAKAEADARIAQAQAEAQAIQLKGEAEATAIEARGKALANNPAVIQLVQAEKWNGTLPQTMIPNGTVPFLSVEK